MPENAVPAKWLRPLFYLHLTILCATILSWLPIQDQWITWLKRILAIGTALCLSQLSPVNQHYGKAAIFRIIHLACLLITALVFSSPFLVLAGAIFSILATYQEYQAHSHLISEQDPALSRKWPRLFGWSILVEVLLSVSSSILSVVTVMMGVDISNIISAVILLPSIPTLIVDVFYLIYLNRTVHLIAE